METETTTADVQQPPPVPPIAPGTGTNTPAVDGGGTGGPVADAGTAERLLRASDDAVAIHLSERHGKRGPDKRPRKPRGNTVPPLGESPADAPLADGAPVPLAPVVADAAPFDEKTAQALVDVTLDLWKDLRDAIVHTVATNELHDAAAAKEAVESQKMSEKVEERFRLGGLLCAKKYSMSTKWAPEVLLGGAFLLSAGQTGVIVRALKAKGAERRARAKEQKTQ